LIGAFVYVPLLNDKNNQGGFVCVCDWMVLVLLFPSHKDVVLLFVVSSFASSSSDPGKYIFICIITYRPEECIYGIPALIECIYSK